MIIEIIAPRGGNKPRKNKMDVSHAPFETTLIPLYNILQRGSEVCSHLSVGSNKFLSRIPVILQRMMMILLEDIVDEHMVNTFGANELTHLDKNDEV